MSEAISQEAPATEARPTFRISATEAVEAVARGALLVDLRGPNGRNRDGEIKGAVVIQKGDVVETLTQRVARSTPGQKTILFCSSIKGSEPLVRALIDTGFSDVFDIEGGAPALLKETAQPTP